MEKLNQNELNVILQSCLFRGTTMDELKSILPCLSAEKRSYLKDEMIYRYGDRIRRVGVVLSGNANIIRDDYWGNRHIVNAIMPGEIFGASYAVLSQTELGVSIQAAVDMGVLLLDIEKLLHVCSSVCVFHTHLIDNFVMSLAYDNLALNEKLTHVTQHSLRDKLLSYLSSESLQNHSPYFDIPFDRQQMADYLGVDRSAMSNELSKMKKDGILDFQKNHFRLIIPAE